MSAAAFDVTDQKAVEAGIPAIEAGIGPIDILINNAGMQKRAPITEFPVEGWHEVMNTNLHSVFYVTQAVTKRMDDCPFSKVVASSAFADQANASCWPSSSTGASSARAEREQSIAAARVAWVFIVGKAFLRGRSSSLMDDD